MANANPKWPFGRSSRIPRSPPPEPDDSTILDPNASSCRLCDDKDTIEMVECEQCKGWYHFHCVGVNSSVSSARWICQTCRERVVDKGRSSTSSKRRSILQLERLAKEKAIHDKLIKEKAELADKLIKEKAELAKQQAAIDAEYLQKEYDIRDNMSELELDGGETEKPDLITWCHDQYLELLSTKRQIPISSPPVPISAQQKLLMPVSMQQQSRSNSISVQPPIVPFSAHQPTVTVSTQWPSVPISAQQSSVPISAQQSSVPISAQQHFVPISMQPTFVPTSTQKPFVPTSIQTLLVSTSTQQPFVPISAYQPSVSVPISVQHQQFVPFSAHQQHSNSHQPVVPTSTVQRQQTTLNSGQQQYSLPVSIYQQPITPNMANQQQFVPNAAQQSMFGFNSMSQPSTAVNLGSLTTSGCSQLQQAPANQWISYDPHLNSQQLLPSSLQLAARQTMPKDYPEFNGDPEKWLIFFNAYVNSTTICGLSNGENLSRIEKCLKGPARKAVQNLLTRPEAVPDIIETLKMLYGRPEASIEPQLSVIKNEPPPKMHKMETFIDFAMSVRNVTSEIQKTGMWQYLWNPQLMQKLVEKLPHEMRLEWGQVKISTPNVNLSNFSDWLFLRAQTACAVTMPLTQSNSNPSGRINTQYNINDPRRQVLAKVILNDSCYDSEQSDNELSDVEYSNNEESDDEYSESERSYSDQCDSERSDNQQSSKRSSPDILIEATKTGQDDRISQVKVRTTNGVYTPPVSKLAVLDLEGPEAKTLTRESSAEGSVTASNDREVAVAYSSH